MTRDWCLKTVDAGVDFTDDGVNDRLQVVVGDPHACKHGEDQRPIGKTRILLLPSEGGDPRELYSRSDAWGPWTKMSWPPILGVHVEDINHDSQPDISFWSFVGSPDRNDYIEIHLINLRPAVWAATGSLPFWPHAEFGDGLTCSGVAPGFVSGRAFQ